MRAVQLFCGLLSVSLAACPAPQPDSNRPGLGASGTQAGSSSPNVGLEPVAVPGSFADNPIVYFVITDRFFNGNPANDNSYGRQRDGDQEIGTFHGGDLAGLTRKLQDGYFRDLGVNALWITAPYEQIYGWVVGGSEAFKHYSYHGYYALDFTILDQNMGTEDELRTFIDTAHAQGIRVIFDVVMNHPGYADHQSLARLGIEVLWDGWEKATLRDYHGFINYNDFKFGGWWGGDWVRAGLPGYKQGPSTDDKLMQLAFLPDFKTESPEAVALPRFLANKPDTRARTIPGYTVRDYLVSWLTDWVRRFGVDGFRCDTAKHVEFESWVALKKAGTAALAEWKAANPDKAIDDAPFWMTGEVFPHGVVRDAYFDNGFDNLINFDFQHSATTKLGDWKAMDQVFSGYATAISRDPGFNVLSYVSSHDTKLFPRNNLMDAGTALLLAPGGVQIFYGDETGRPPGPTPSSDPQQSTRSSMNWNAIDKDLLSHWSTLATFRRRHVALSKGSHQKLADAPYTFARVHGRDRVVVAIGAPAGVPATITVGTTFADGDTVQDAYSGTQAVVSGGSVTVTPHARGVVLLEAMRPRAGSQ